jgi:hypothetical protein
MSYIGSKPADAVLETDDIADGVVTNPKLSKTYRKPTKFQKHHHQWRYEHCSKRNFNCFYNF